MMKSVHILLVEDNEGDVVLTREALKNSAVTNSISVATDGEEALDFLFCRGKYEQAYRPDLIILDINIPKISGLEVLKIIKETDHLKTIPVIILTNSSAGNDIRKAYYNHANCYIIKPHDFPKFRSVVKEIESFWFSLVTIPNH